MKNTSGHESIKSNAPKFRDRLTDWVLDPENQQRVFDLGPAVVFGGLALAALVTKAVDMAGAIHAFQNALPASNFATPSVQPQIPGEFFQQISQP